MRSLLFMRLMAQRSERGSLQERCQEGRVEESRKSRNRGERSGGGTKRFSRQSTRDRIERPRVSTDYLRSAGVFGLVGSQQRLHGVGEERDHDDDGDQEQH